MKVLAICAFPAEFACTRYRLIQYIGPLRASGIELEVRPFFTSEEYEYFYREMNALSRLKTIVGPLARRVADVVRASKADLLIVQREAVFFGPAFFETLYKYVGRLPLVVDLDDATYLPYDSPRYGSFGNALKFFGKTDSLIKRADLVITGGRFVAEYAEDLGAKTLILPTTVDPSVFKPTQKHNDRPVIGWIGTASSYPFLKSIFPALEALAKQHDFTLLLRGTGEDEISINGVDIDNRPWSLATETEDFRSLDIGLYPLVVNDAISRERIEGKSGFKAIQHMALGIPYVVSPIGVVSEIGKPGETHFEASTTEDWIDKLGQLLSDRSLREKMGNAGRAHYLKQYDLQNLSKILADALLQTAREKNGRRSKNS